MRLKFVFTNAFWFFFFCLPFTCEEKIFSVALMPIACII